MGKIEIADFVEPAGAGLLRTEIHGKQFHIRESDGQPAYSQRYYYVGKFNHVGGGMHLARVLLYHKVTFHIHTDGRRAYGQNYASVGPFVCGIARIETLDGVFYYILPDGSRLNDENFTAAGNFDPDTGKAPAWQGKERLFVYVYADGRIGPYEY